MTPSVIHTIDAANPGSAYDDYFLTGTRWILTSVISIGFNWAFLPAEI